MPLLKEDELDNVVHKYDVETHSADNTITARLLTSIWQRLATKFVPADISPNALSLAALLCLLQATYLCYQYYDVEPKVTTVAAGVLIFAFWTLDSLDAVHAKNVGSNTTLTLIFDSFCSSCGTVFLTVIVCWCFGVTDPRTLWYAVQASQLILLNKHIKGAVKQVVSYWLFNGPGELLSTLVMLLIVRASFGLEFVGHVFFFVVSYTVRPVMDQLHQTPLYQTMAASSLFVDVELPNVESLAEDPYGSTLYALRVSSSTQ